jgi:hypothetical protein
LHNPEPNDVNDQVSPSRRVETARHQTIPDNGVGSMEIEQESQTKSATDQRRVTALWPMALLAVAGVANLGWLIGMAWAAVELVRTLAG